MVENAFCGEPLLYTPIFKLSFVLQTDVLDRELRAILSQELESGPVLYLSKKLTEWEERYSTMEKVSGHLVVGRFTTLLPGIAHSLSFSARTTLHFDP